MGNPAYPKFGQRRRTREKYREAILACDDVRYIEYNVSQIARIFDLNPSGLSNQLRSHFPEILQRRERERDSRGISDRCHRGARSVSKEQYAVAVDHIRESDDTLEAIADRFNVSYPGLREYLAAYHKDLLKERAARREARRLMASEEEALKRRKKTKRYKSSTALKYKEAIERLKKTGATTAEVAREFSLNPDVFREYLREHEPDLASSLGRKLSASGKMVSARSEEKYAAAIAIFETTPETLKSIASRLNLNYKSLYGYVSRNCREAMEKHIRLLADC